MASSTEMQFGPSWLKPTTRTKSSKTSTPLEENNNNNSSNAAPAAISYSSITRDHPTPLSPGSGGHEGGGANGEGGPPLDHIVDPSKPFRYTKEYMLGLYDEEKQKGRELPFEFERWGVVFREEGGNPVSLAPLTDMEKKLFTLPYNPDRRAPNSSDPLHPSASRNNSSNDLHSRRNRTLAGQAGTLNLERGSDRAIGERGERGGSALNSPARERFGGIQGGVLGGLAGAGGVGEGRLGGLSRERSDRRTSGRGGPKDGEVDLASIAPLPPSSTQSWRPTRTLSSNNPPPATPPLDSPSLEESRPRWRDAPAPAASREIASRDRDARDELDAGGGFGGAGGQRAGGWRERERVRTAERDLGAAAGWENVGAAGTTKKPAAATRADGTPSSGRQDYGNSFAALEQEEDSFEPEAPAAPTAPQVSAHALAQAAAEAQREELKQVKWMYKDPSGAIQGPFPASSMQDWHGQGYFNASLLVKREADLAFETVATLTQLAPSTEVIFFLPAPVRPAAPPGMISRGSTPGYASPIASYSTSNAYAASPIQQHQDGSMTPSRLAGADPLDRFLRQQGEKPNEEEANGARWNDQQQQQSPVVQQQYPQQQQQLYAQQPLGGGAYDPAPLGYGNNSPAPRHMAYNALGRQAPLQAGVFAQSQSPYSSPVVQHQAPSPWTQQQQPQQQQQTPVRNYYGLAEGQQLGSPSPVARVPYQYSPVQNLAPGAGWGANDWRNAPSPGQMPLQPQQIPQQQQQHSYLNQLIPGSVQQHQQLAPVAPWASSPSVEVAQPIQQQQVPQEAQQQQQQVQVEEQQQAPASRWAQPLSHASVPSTPAQNSPVETSFDSLAIQEQPAQVQAAPVVVEQPVESAPTPPATKAAKSVAAPLPTKPTPAQKANPVAPVVVEEPRATTPSVAPKVAPWANEEKKAPTGPSLREIQDAEARKVAAAKAARPPAPVKEVSNEPPTSTSWGLMGSSSNTAPVKEKSSASTGPAVAAPPVWQMGGAAPSRTLKQIQEEETKQKARVAQAKAAQIAAMGGNVAPKGAYAGAASSAPSSNSNAGGAWAVVGAGGKSSSSSTTAPKPAGLPSSIPARPLSQATVKPTIPAVSAIQSSSTFAGKLSRSGSSASLDDISPSSDFLLWAKSSLKSVTGVNIDEFLQMLLSFPLNPDPAVMEIISDSIYANSATLDGRRFAQEFCTKRKADAKGQKAGTIPSGNNNSSSLGRGSSLADIVKAQPKPAADAGFGGFKVVKKKGKKQ
ncbi:hypothetical protein BDY24DRAFT_418298 [Mrakia frigida]|uniref:uncharacterized protein n=1 Tax=Mrakia frigida TaxID=29902 RepID=UPI003FCC03FE